MGLLQWAKWLHLVCISFYLWQNTTHTVLHNRHCIQWHTKSMRLVTCFAGHPHHALLFLPKADVIFKGEKIKQELGEQKKEQLKKKWFPFKAKGKQSLITVFITTNLTPSPVIFFTIPLISTIPYDWLVMCLSAWIAQNTSTFHALN